MWWIWADPRSKASSCILKGVLHLTHAGFAHAQSNWEREWVTSKRPQRKKKKKRKLRPSLYVLWQFMGSWELAKTAAACSKHQERCQQNHTSCRSPTSLLADWSSSSSPTLGGAPIKWRPTTHKMLPVAFVKSLRINSAIFVWPYRYWRTRIKKENFELKELAKISGKFKVLKMQW